MSTNRIFSIGPGYERHFYEGQPIEFQYLAENYTGQLYWKITAYSGADALKKEDVANVVGGTLDTESETPKGTITAGNSTLTITFTADGLSETDPAEFTVSLMVDSINGSTVATSGPVILHNTTAPDPVVDTPSTVVNVPAGETFDDTTSNPVTGGGGGGGGGGGTGWPGMNAVVQAYIDQANEEIAQIKEDNGIKSRNLNIAYSAAGAQLTKEQRARFIGIPPVPSPTRNPKMNPFPMALLGFVDAIPSLSLDTRPHMYAQTLEAIVDMNTISGQSVVAMARESRNQARLQLVGASLDNELPGSFSQSAIKTLISNGTISSFPDLTSATTTGTIIPDTGTTPITDDVDLTEGVVNDDGINGHTPPGILIIEYPPGTIVTPDPWGHYETDTGEYIETEYTTDVGDVSPIDGLLPPNGDDLTTGDPDDTGTGGSDTGAGDQDDTRPDIDGPGPVVVGPRLPRQGRDPVDMGQGFPGSLGGSEYVNLLPPNLKWPYTTATLTPSSYTVAEAINEVIKCNCDCWID